MLKIYNSLTRQIEDFKPLIEGKVKMYVCGLTVYDSPHLGHGMSAVMFDMIRKYLIFKGFDVTLVRNYTDIDDKMINRAKERSITVPQLANEVIKECNTEFAKLNVDTANYEPKATDFIEKIIEIISELKKQDIAYIIEGDGVYYDVKKFEEYGKLKKQNLEDLQVGVRIDVVKGKRNPVDFVLWKFEKPGEPSWESPWGKGRPGWHIECTAMIKEIFAGDTIDIHGGGEDLLFPHHDCEIAQAEKFDQKQYVKYWMHNGLVMIDSEKMSKSLGNFFTLKDIFAKYDPLTIRFYFLQSHYRQPLNFHQLGIEQAKNSLEKIHNFYYNLKDYVPDSNQFDSIDSLIDEFMFKFEQAMDEDFSTSNAIAALYEFIGTVNRLIKAKQLNGEDVDKILEALQKVDQIFSILPKLDNSYDQEINNLLEQREEARKAKDYQLADQIRDEIEQKYQVKLLDKPGAPTTWRKF